MRFIDLGWATSFAIGLTIVPLTLPITSTAQMLLPVASAQSTANSIAEATRLINQRNQRVNASQYQAAIQSYQQALRIFREIGAHGGEADLLLSISSIWVYLLPLLLKRRRSRGLAIVTTTASNWIVGINAHHGNPADGATLKPALAQVERLSGLKPQQALVDQGFWGRNYHPPEVEVLLCDPHKHPKHLKRLFKHRSAIEPIEQAKHDHALGRNYLQGQIGDRINALLIGCGFNLRKLCCFLTSIALDTVQSTA